MSAAAALGIAGGVAWGLVAVLGLLLRRAHRKLGEESQRAEHFRRSSESLLAQVMALSAAPPDAGERRRMLHRLTGSDGEALPEADES